MRTDLFSQFPVLDDRFRDHLDIVWKLEPSVRQTLVSAVVEAYLAQTAGEANAAIEDAVGRIRGDTPQLLKAAYVLRFLAREWNPVRDTPEAILSDLRELKIVPPDKNQEAEELVLQLFSELEKSRTRQIREMFENSVVPSFKGVTITADFRLAFDNFFGSGRNDEIDTYKPNYLGYSPVLLIRIRATDDQSFVFQCNVREAKRMVDFIQAALLDAAAAQSALGSDPL